MQTQELVTLVPWTFIAQICNLFIQVYLFKKFLLGPVREIIAKRREMATAELDEARKSKEEAAAMKAEYEKDIADAKDRANAIVSSANKAATAKSEEIISKAKEEAVLIKNKATADIEQEKKQALDQIKNDIGSMAMEIAGKVIEREVNEDDHKKLIAEFIENVGEEK